MGNRTFKHLTAGSNTIMPNGKVLVFGGRPGGVGFYTTDDEDEIKHLLQLVKSPTAPVEEEKTEVAEASAETLVTAVLTKPADPALQEAVKDAAASAEKAADPNIVSAQEKLSSLIAKNGTATVAAQAAPANNPAP